MIFSALYVTLYIHHFSPRKKKMGGTYLRLLLAIVELPLDGVGLLDAADRVKRLPLVGHVLLAGIPLSESTVLRDAG